MVAEEAVGELKSEGNDYAWSLILERPHVYDTNDQFRPAPLLGSLSSVWPTK